MKNSIFTVLLCIILISNCFSCADESLLDENIKKEIRTLTKKINEINISDANQTLYDKNIRDSLVEKLNNKLLINVFLKDKNLGNDLFKTIKLKNNDFIYKNIAIKSIGENIENTDIFLKKIVNPLQKEIVRLELAKYYLDKNISKSKKIVNELAIESLFVEGLIFIADTEFKNSKNDYTFIEKAIKKNNQFNGKKYYEHLFSIIKVLLNYKKDEGIKLFDTINKEYLFDDEELLKNYVNLYSKINTEEAISFIESIQNNPLKKKLISYNLPFLLDYDTDLLIEKVNNLNEEIKIELYIEIIETLHNKYGYNFILKEKFIQKFADKLKNPLSVRTYYIKVAKFLSQFDLDMALSISLSLKEDKLEEEIYYYALKTLVKKDKQETIEKISTFENTEIRFYSYVQVAKLLQQNKKYCNLMIDKANQILENTKEIFLKEQMLNYFVVNLIDVKYDLSIKLINEITNYSLFYSALKDTIKPIFQENPSQAYSLIQSTKNVYEKVKLYTKILDLI